MCVASNGGGLPFTNCSKSKGMLLLWW